MKKVCIIIVLGFSLIACRSTKKSSDNIVVEKNNTASLNGSWKLVMLFASDNKWGKTPQVNFNIAEKTFSGNSGCNTIRGKFTTDGNYLAFDKNFIMTKMACPGSNENAFLAALLKINRYSVNKDELELGQGEIVLMKFNRTSN